MKKYKWKKRPTWAELDKIGIGPGPCSGSKYLPDAKEIIATLRCSTWVRTSDGWNIPLSMLTEIKPKKKKEKKQ